MQLFIDGDEITVEELRHRLDNLDCGEFDDGTYEDVVLDHISMAGDMYFETERRSVY